MAVKLHRCPDEWVKIKGHPCWRVERALMDMGVEYDLAPGPRSRSKRTLIVDATGQSKYPAIQFEDGTWYREESKAMERTIRGGHLMEKDTGTATAVAEPDSAAEPGPKTPEVH